MTPRISTRVIILFASFFILETVLVDAEKGHIVVNDCPSSCEGLTDGIYASCKSCSHFLMCIFGEMYDTYQCREGYYYDSVARDCLTETTTCEMVEVVPTTAKPTTQKPTEATTAEQTTERYTTAKPTTAKPTTVRPTTARPTTEKPTTARPTTAKPTTARPSTAKPTTARPTTARPTTAGPTTARPTTEKPTTAKPTTARPTTANPTTARPTTVRPTTAKPTTARPTTAKPTTAKPTTVRPTTEKPTTAAPPAPTTDGGDFKPGDCVSSCKGVPDGDYQSCESCHYYASCTNGFIIHPRYCPANLVWDDNAKMCMGTSTTCK